MPTTTPRRRRHRHLAPSLAIAAALTCTATAVAAAPNLHLELPVGDLPFQVSPGPAWPSMEQSLWVSVDIYQGTHHLIGRIVDPFSDDWRLRLAGKSLITAFDLLTILVPGFMGWQHEEWHRAVMSSRGIDSFNDIYKLNLTGGVINVSHIQDEDLVRLKAQHPADQVRMSTAGIEGLYAAVQTVERLQFFDNVRTWNTASLWIYNIVNSAYLGQCASTASDQTTREEREQEGADVPRRDFIGLDCDGWTYDLFRPDEPFDARGVHPSGVGINRSRSYSELAPAEQRFVRLQSRLSLLNFLDPNLVGVRRMRLPWQVAGEAVDFNLALRWIPAAFGYDIRLDLFAQRKEIQNLLVSLHGYFNHRGPLPGIEALLYRLPRGTLAGKPLVVGARVAGWLQPERLRYDSNQVTVGGLIGLRASVRLFPVFEPYFEVEAKSAGWVMGNVYTDANLSARLGVVAEL